MSSGLDQPIRAALTGDYTTLQPVPQSYFVRKSGVWVCPANVVAQLPAGLFNQLPVRVMTIGITIDLVRQLSTGQILVRFSPSCTNQVSTLIAEARRSEGVQIGTTMRIRTFEINGEQPTRFVMFNVSPTGQVQRFNINFNHGYHSGNRWAYR
ncbi:hypothetical protein [Mechercharimyces sp. CAU 1602]|uniref:hypothetical protein n=1 Tax=Mechercharimyces sp. CAU 1602 TaxID=2973933 RepID=UPI002162B33A|nr:hypothetical protein [Mechercharimyces sp. CAU 1602]MCS1350641.1 hypothetical protein [Mechercharimyces sp. CAU 1602]